MIYAFVPITPNTPIGGIGALVEYITSTNILMGKDEGAILTDSSYIKDWLPPSQKNIKIFPKIMLKRLPFLFRLFTRI